MRAHGLLFLTAPGVDLVTVLAPENRTTPYDAYLRLGIAADAARYADVVDIQAQGSERDTTFYANFVVQAAAQARQANPNVLVLAGISTNPSGQQVTPMIYFAPSPPHATASTAIGSVFRRRPSIAQVVTASARTSQSKCSVVLPHNNTR